MNVSIPKSYTALPRKQKEAITEYCRQVALEAAQKTTEKDARIILDLYTKMVCKVLHDTFGFGEKRLYLFLGAHKRLFKEQVKMVSAGTQVPYLNEEMGKIFRKSGYPKEFFEDMLGKVEDG